MRCVVSFILPTVGGETPPTPPPFSGEGPRTPLLLHVRPSIPASGHKSQFAQVFFRDRSRGPSPALYHWSPPLTQLVGLAV